MCICDNVVGNTKHINLWRICDKIGVIVMYITTVLKHPYDPSPKRFPLFCI